VSDGVYREHTVCFGLFFRKMHIERSYLDGQARLDKTMVYFGYFLYVLVLLPDYLYGYFELHSEYALCKPPEKKQVCFESFSPATYSFAQNVESLSSLSGYKYYTEIVNRSAYRNIPASAGILFGLVVLGCASH